MIRDFRALPHGLYRLHWKTGGWSLAAVGSLYDGSRWFAASNWTAERRIGIASESWDHVDHVEPLLIDSGLAAGTYSEAQQGEIRAALEAFASTLLGKQRPRD